MDTHEIGGGVVSSQLIKSDQSGLALDGTSRLVEADMSSSANTENLEVETSESGNLLFIVLAELVDLRLLQSTVRNIDIFLWNINMVEEMLVGVFILHKLLSNVGVFYYVFHVLIIALESCFGDWVVLIEVEGDHVFERESLFLVKSDEFHVDSFRGGAGS